ncbi:MAG: hypothetical protein FWD11_09145 [Micrococcales bacterium]|nr:hypothetical protein [Micrococcales bacterium]
MSSVSPATGSSEGTTVWLGRRVWEDRRLRFAAAGLVVVLVVVVGVFVVRGREATGVPGVAGHARSPAQVGMGYLTAIATGSASDALAYVEAKPRSTVFMTDAVLAESAKLNPITDIEVLSSSHHDKVGAVTMSYRLGEIRVIDTYPVAKSHDGYWQISPGREGPQTPGFATVTVRSSVTLQITLNGVQVEPGSERLQLFPGTYRVGTAHPMLAVSKVLVVPGLSPRLGGVTDLNPGARLTPQARQSVNDALAATFDACLQETTLTTSCGMSLRDLYREDVIDGAPVSWAVAPGSIDITETTARVVTGEYRFFDCVEANEGRLWAYWSQTPFETIRVRAAPAAGSSSFGYHDELYTYGVEISDPDHLHVYLQWLDGSLAMCRKSKDS